jgi:D-xylose transport system substrate-binding protein
MPELLEEEWLMKRTFRAIVVLLTVMLFVSVLAGCKTAAAPTPAPAPVAQKLKIGLSLATLQEERWVRDKDRITKDCADQGIELLTQIANMDAATQESQCENLFTQGINVLILAPQDAAAAATIVDKAHAAGVKVISYDRLVMNTANDDVYISFDNVQVGVLQGTWLTTAVPKGNYAILSGAPTDNNAKLFKQGAMSIIQPLVDKGDIKIVADQPVVEWKPENAQKIMENALTANKNNIQGILAPNDGTAGGCIQALAAQGLAGKVPITGQDAELAAAQRIVKGTQGMTVFKDTRMLGDAAVEAAKTMFAGQPLAKATQTVNNGTMDVPSILLVPIAVTKENIDATLIASGYLLKADVYK